jgi:hypothetical protein
MATSPSLVTNASAPPARPPWDTPDNVARLQRLAASLPWIALALVIAGCSGP